MQAGVSPFRSFMLYWLCVFIIMFLCMQYFLNVPIKIIIIIIKFIRPAKAHWLATLQLDSQTIVR